MPDAVVHYRNSGDAEWKHLDLTINGPGANFQIITKKIAAALHDTPDDLHLDLLDVAATINAADRAVRRGGNTRLHLGERWQREFRFAIKVRRLEFWSRDEITAALCDVVGFLTEDDVSFTFSDGRRQLPQQDYLPVDRLADWHSQKPHVLLFSGGLDSLAGAIETLERETGPVLLVTHHSAQKIMPHQDRLADALKQRYPGRVTYIPIKATFVGRDAPETTQRSRSFLFAAFGFVLAQLVGSDRLHFFENGVVSHNLPINRHVIGTMATRTTHPLVLHRMEGLLTRLADDRFGVVNPYAWRTKKDVVEVLRDHGVPHLIADTVSCNQVRDRSTEKTHCGSCSQCLDRRFALLAAGMEEDDPEDAYEVPVLLGDGRTERQRTLALDWSAHAVRLANESADDFAGRFMGELSRIVEGFPNLQPEEVLLRGHALQQRHGAAVKAVFEQAVSHRAGAIIEQSLPEDSLLRMFVATQAGAVTLPDLSRPDPVGEPPVIDTMDLDDAPLWPLRVAMETDDRGPWVEVKGLGTVRGMPAMPAHALRPPFENDRVKGLAPQDHRFTRAGYLAGEAGASKQAVAQNVRRCRSELAELYRIVEGEPPNRHLLIQSRRPYGYRLDPEIKLLTTLR